MLAPPLHPRTFTRFEDSRPLMSRPIISVDDLGKHYQLGRQQAIKIKALYSFGLHAA